MADNGDAAGGNSADGVQDLTAVVQTLLTQMVRAGHVERTRDVATNGHPASNSTAACSKTAWHMKKREKKGDVAVVYTVREENTKDVIWNRVGQAG